MIEATALQEIQDPAPAASTRDELAAALLSQDIPIEDTVRARQAVWRAFAKAWRDLQADECYTLLELQEAKDRLLGHIG